MKTQTTIAAAAVLCALSFWLGRLSIAHQVVTYSVEGNPKAFPRDVPAYGLPLVDYTAVLLEFRSDHSEKALSYLETFLDGAIQSAAVRRPLLRGWRLAELDKALYKVARYREQYPRPLSQGTGFYWTADKQAAVDSFLRTYSK